MTLKRTISIRKNSSFFLLGPRQTGKSTLIRSLFGNENILVIDLLTTANFMRFAANPSLLSSEVLQHLKKVTHVFIDEVQKVPQLLDEVHSLIEQKLNVHFILTGSSARKLRRVGANMLAGRALTYFLHPFSFEELGQHFDLNKVLSIGSLPAIYLQESPEHASDYLRSYVETYLKEEIEAEAIVRQLGSFIRFLLVAGRESGNIINFSNIANDVGTSSITTKEYFKVLEDTLIGRFLFPFQRSTRKRLSKQPKFYIFDTGVLRAMSKQLNNEVLPMTSEFGRLFEHWVVNESIKISDYYKKDFEFSFYHTNAGAEVDLIIETPKGEMLAVEIKSSPNPSPSSFEKGFVSFREVVKKCKTIVVSTTPRSYKEKDTEVLSYSDFFDLIRNLA